MEQISGGSVWVACSLIFAIAGIGIVAIIRYNVDGALKVLAGLTGLFGMILGAFVTYFFTRYPIAQSRNEAFTAKAELTQLSSEYSALLTKIASAPDHTDIGKFRKDPDFTALISHRFLSGRMPREK